MNESSKFEASPTRFVLRFTGLFDRGRGYAFPCDADGRVDVEGLSDQARSNYFHACAVVGKELSAPIVTGA